MVNKKDLKMLDVLVNKATKRRVVNIKYLKMLDVFVYKIAERYVVHVNKIEKWLLNKMAEAWQNLRC